MIDIDLQYLLNRPNRLIRYGYSNKVRDFSVIQRLLIHIQFLTRHTLRECTGTVFHWLQPIWQPQARRIVPALFCCMALMTRAVFDSLRAILYSRLAKGTTGLFCGTSLDNEVQLLPTLSTIGANKPRPTFVGNPN